MDESEEKKGEVKEETKEEEKAEPPEIVLGVYMHCHACAKKVENSLRKIQGVEEVKADPKTQRVVIKGNMADLDPIKACETVEKKTGRKTVLVSPLPNKPAEEKQEEEKQEEDKEKEKEEAPKQADDDNKQEPTPITVVLKMKMHCEACAHVLQKRIKKMEGVDTVETDLLNDRVMIKGLVDPEKLVDCVCRRTRKHVSIIKEDETKEEEDENKGKEDENKEEEVKGEDAASAAADDDTKMYHEYWPPKDHTENNYGPQIFSDENPNSCSLM